MSSKYINYVFRQLYLEALLSKRIHLILLKSHSRQTYVSSRIIPSTETNDMQNVTIVGTSSNHQEQQYVMASTS